MTPGSQRFWNPPSSADEDLGVRGQGTDAQKYTRLDALRMARQPSTPVVQGGGHGMGGGGGRPGEIPALPPDFNPNPNL